MPVDNLRNKEGAELHEIVFHNLVRGSYSDIRRYRIFNPSLVTMTSVRIYAKLTSGAFVGGSKEMGQEMQDQKWVQVRSLGLGTDVDTASPSESLVPFKPIGGTYGLAENGSDLGPNNYLALPDIVVGQYVLIELRIYVPSNATTERTATCRWGVSFEGDVS